MSARLPQFLIIGAQKAGTSWLHARLRAQPGLFLPGDKDFEYFSHPADHAESAFGRRFDAAPAASLVGDACASYFWTTGHSADNPGFARDLPFAIERALGPGCRYIVLLRDPVMRTISAYLHHIAFGSLAPTTRLQDAPSALGLIDISRYGVHLDGWLDAVPPERLLVLPAPGEAPPERILGPVQRFLDTPVRVDERADRPVLPGLERRIDDRGVWVAVGAHGVPEAVGPTAEFDGRRYTLIVDTAAIDRVADRLAGDTRRLARRLRALDRVDPAYRSWRTWPAGS